MKASPDAIQKFLDILRSMNPTVRVLIVVVGVAALVGLGVLVAEIPSDDSNEPVAVNTGDAAAMDRQPAANGQPAASTASTTSTSTTSTTSTTSSTSTTTTSTTTATTTENTD
jgi:cytoskeletal protein RodZ